MRARSNGFFASILLLLLSFNVKAESSKILGLELAAGSPQVLSVQLVYWGLGPVGIGIGFGSAPVNAVLQSAVPTSTIPLSLGLPDAYSLIPSTSFSLTTTSLFVRYKPSGAPGTGFITELNLARWGFAASLNGTLLNQTTGERTSGVASGRLDLGQPVLSAIVGYQFGITESLSVLVSGGISYLFSTSYTSSVGGSILTALPVAGAAAQADFENAKANLNSQVRSGVDSVRSRVQFLPSLSVTVGYLF